MHLQSSLLGLLTLAATTLALPTTTTTTTPKTFDARAINYFRPDTTRNPNPAPLFSFSYSDSTTNVSTSCSNTSGDVAVPTTCADPVVSFSFNTTSNTLTVSEVLSDPISRITVSGDLSMALNCYPVIPPVPYGYGTLCQNVGGTLTGFFTRAVA
ncbi:hypothetical protein PVAG01_10855 [Phlyctema vagabunda]|uniref:Uncharacterized protein n=1 Tax=Phlyctema vagabunda TaxID=108571 RepID=A0ABR4P3F5_9HELO